MEETLDSGANTIEAKAYPRVAIRVKAVIFDTFTLIGLMILAAQIFAWIGEVPDGARIAVVAFIALLYDPLFTSLSGGTFGHHICGIRVKRSANETRNILFPMALLRYALKLMLGWISLLTVSGHSKGKAIHDAISGSVVVYEQG